MPVNATALLHCRIPVDLAEALDAESRRSGRTKTDIVVAGLKSVLAKGAETMTTAEELAARCNADLDENARRTAQILGMDNSIDEETTEKLLSIIGDSDPVAFFDGTFVRCTDEGRYVAETNVTEWIAEHT